MSALVCVNRASAVDNARIDRQVRRYRATMTGQAEW